MIDVVVFDMDGVIIDSEPVWQQVRVDLIGDRGGVWTDRDGDDTGGGGPRRCGRHEFRNVLEVS
jgi:beta-phosphoglucomutase-like phosphatase (HAD superfamily)